MQLQQTQYIEVKEVQKYILHFYQNLKYSIIGKDMLSNQIRCN